MTTPTTPTFWKDGEDSLDPEADCKPIALRAGMADEGQTCVLRIGGGDQDGGDVTFSVGAPAGYGRPGNYRFQGPNGNDVLRIDSEGGFWVNGELVAEDRLVYEGFRTWLSMALRNR